MTMERDLVNAADITRVQACQNLYVTVYEPLCRSRDCCWLCSKVGIHIVLCLVV